MGKGNRKGISLLTGSGGISAQPGGAVARQAVHGKGNDAGTASWARAHALREEGGNGVGGGKAVCGGENRSPVRFRGGFSSVVRFYVDGMVARHEQR
jgi:hypothetical protein